MIKQSLGIILLLIVVGGALMASSGEAAPSSCSRADACLSTSVIKDEIRATFGVYAPRALRIAACESGFNANAYNPASGTMGIFQFAPGTWHRTPFAHDNPFSAPLNIRAAFYLFVHDGYSWHEWSCQ